MGGSHWSKEEDAVIIAHYATARRAKILEMLPSRSWKSVKTRAYKLRVFREFPEPYTRKESQKGGQRISSVCEWLEEHMDRVGVSDTSDRQALYKERAKGDCQFAHCCRHAEEACRCKRPRPVIDGYAQDSPPPKHGGMATGYRFNTSIHHL